MQAGQQLSLQSGADTTLKGAVAKGEQVTLNVGGSSTCKACKTPATTAANSRSQSTTVQTSQTARPSQVATTQAKPRAPAWSAAQVAQLTCDINQPQAVLAAQGRTRPVRPK